MGELYPRQIYLLSQKDLSPETIAVTFAKTSRSPSSFRDIAAELTDEKSAKFHEKWVVGYGHASVAEHAVLHIAFENISRLAIECIESNRLASYTEKSTRYQKWDPNSYHLPVEIAGTEREAVYRQTCEVLFRAYRDSLAPVRGVVQSQFPRREGESDARWDSRVRSRYVDACRFLLPSAALANVGMTANARTMEHAIGKMLSHPLAEVREIGEEVREIGQLETPTLVKYADRNSYLVETEAELGRRARDLQVAADGDWFRLVSYDPAASLRVIAASLYAHIPGSVAAIVGKLKEMSESDLRSLAKVIFGGIGEFDAPIRPLEHAWYTFDVLMDQGAYFEVKRHRMMTQTPQMLSCELGYTIPRLIEESGFAARYREAMATAHRGYDELAAWNPAVAAYVVPNGYKRRVLMTLNLREAYHFCELRSASNAHFSVRRIALRTAEELRKVHPLLAQFMRLPEGETWRSVEEEHFSET
jgi:thymidylate synthase ThyX